MNYQKIEKMQLRAPARSCTVTVTVTVTKRETVVHAEGEDSSLTRAHESLLFGFNHESLLFGFNHESLLLHTHTHICREELM